MSDESNLILTSEETQTNSIPCLNCKSTHTIFKTSNYLNTENNQKSKLIFGICLSCPAITRTDLIILKENK